MTWQEHPPRQTKVNDVSQQTAREHIREALTAIRRGQDEGIPIPPKRKSRVYCLIEGGSHFPPEYVMSVASEISEGRDLSLPVGSERRDTTSARQILEYFGFHVAKCNCGGSDEFRAGMKEVRQALADLHLSGLHRAVQEGDIEKITALLDAGDDPNVRDSLGHTPISANLFSELVCVP